MALTLKTIVGAGAVLLASQAALASVTLYEGEGFRGRAVVIDEPMPNLRRADFNNSAGSIIVDRGRWEVCERPRFEGRCALLRRGHYDTLRGSGLEWEISSIRPAPRGERRYDVEPAISSAPLYEYRVRPDDRIREVPVLWSRAVMGAAQQRCWVERQAVPAANANANVGGAIAGALIGGILGHQVGGGSGRDAATALGAAAGAAVGSGAVGSQGYATQDVQRCSTAVSGPPAYYEVAYNFQGQQHIVQMSAPPGPTIAVNARGEPRM